MAKNNRGKKLYKLPSRSRGSCSLCYRKRIKLLYNYKTPANSTIQVCKFCKDK